MHVSSKFRTAHKVNKHFWKYDIYDREALQPQRNNVQNKIPFLSHAHEEWHTWLSINLILIREMLLLPIFLHLSSFCAHNAGHGCLCWSVTVCACLQLSHLFALWLPAPSFPARGSGDMNDTNPSATCSYLQTRSLPSDWTGWLTCLLFVWRLSVLCLSLIHPLVNLRFFHLFNRKTPQLLTDSSVQFFNPPTIDFALVNYCWMKVSMRRKYDSKYFIICVCLWAQANIINECVSGSL